MRRNKGELVPATDIIPTKKSDEASYLEVKDTGAKISMRDAKQLIESFCLAASDKSISLTIKDKTSSTNESVQSNYDKEGGD
jgi:hypothetical protein